MPDCNGHAENDLPSFFFFHVSFDISFDIFVVKFAEKFSSPSIIYIITFLPSIIIFRIVSICLNEYLTGSIMQSCALRIKDYRNIAFKMYRVIHYV